MARAYLPSIISSPPAVVAIVAAEIAAALDAAVTETGAASIRDVGKVMAALKARYTGQMDFGAVGALVKARLG